MSSVADFAKANIDELVEALSQDEAIALTAGVGFWNTAKVPRLGIPTLKVSDGPNGIRGSRFFNSTPAKAIPSATGLGATFDPTLIREITSQILAPEAKLRGASVVLAPTVNIQRSPLGGRSFESFSEDPFLSGTIAAAYINGLQEQGIGSCIKHFVCNDQEDDRQGVNSELSQRALREVYLMPFMLAEKNSKPWAYMTAYNKVNGLHASENPFLLKQVLREEWGSEATVMSDWFGVYSISDSINAGLDLEMPGTRKFRGEHPMSWSIHSRKMTLQTVKARAKKVIELVQRAANGAPELLDENYPEKSIDKEEDNALMRRLAAESIVLLKNERVLPLEAESLSSVAIIGGNAKAIVLSGGGSASLKPTFFHSPYDGITRALKPSTKVSYVEGARTFQNMPTLDFEIVNSKGDRGFDATWYAHDKDDVLIPVVVDTAVASETMVFVIDSVPESISKKWTMKLKGFMKPRDEDTLFEFGLQVAGKAKLFIDGELVIDNWSHQRRGKSFYGTGTEEERGKYLLKKGVSHEVCVEFRNIYGPADGDMQEGNIVTGPGVRLGGAVVINEAAEIEKAVEAAKQSEVAIVIIGLDGDWESEGFDRTTLKLPGRTDELVARVSQANPRTIVVTQTGSAVEMPWVNDVPALLQSWYLGNTTGDAIADVIFGKVNPGAKLSITFPKRLEDTPSYGHFGSENGTVWYAEDLFVGYKHYVRAKVPTLFPFGHGLSYTSFKLSDLEVTTPSGPELSFVARVKVENTGARVGSEVVQIYVTPSSDTKLTHPVRALKGFNKVRDLKPGQCVVAEVNLDKYALSYWCSVENHWKIEKGTYTIVVGANAEDEAITAKVEVPREVRWEGL